MSSRTLRLAGETESTLHSDIPFLHSVFAHHVPAANRTSEISDLMQITDQWGREQTDK